MKTHFISLRAISFLTVAAIAFGSKASAAILYWDGGTVDIATDGNGLSNGAAGNWNTTLTNWDEGASAHVAWNNADFDIAAFGRTGVAGGTVTLTAPVTVGGLVFYGTGYTLASGTQGLTFGATNNNITLFGSTGATASASITGLVGGSGNVSFTSANPVVTGTMTFSGISAGGWTGTTTINSNMILATTTTSGNVNQVLNSTSGITLNGGAIQFNRATNAQLNAISDTAAITVNSGGTFGITSGDAGGASANETIGAVTVNSGQMNFNWTNGASSGAQIILSNLTNNGTSAVTFSGNLGSTGRFNVIGAGTTAANEIIGAWATTGGANGIAAQTDYAVYNGDFVAARNIAASAQSTWSTTHAATSNYTLNMTNVTAAANGRLDVDRNINTLRNITNSAAPSLVDATTDYITMVGNDLSDGDVVVSRNTTGGQLTPGRAYYVINAGVAGAGTFQVSTTQGGAAVNLTATTAGFISAGLNLNGNTLGTYGILNGSSDPMAIGGGSGSSITLPTTTSGNLYVTNGNASIWIDAPITDNGLGVLTLVKGGTSGNGSGDVTLSGINTYTGGTVINSGTLSISSVDNIGGSAANLTFNGNGTLRNYTGSTLNFSSGTLTVNQGAVANLQPGVTSAGITFATTTGSGNLIANLTSNATMNLGNASGFTGNIQARLNGNINQSGAVSIQFSSLADTAGSFLQFAGGQSDGNQSINIAFNGSAPLVFNNRVIQMLPRTGSNWIARDTFISNNSASAANTWTINTDLDWEYTASTNPSTRNFTLAGSNTGDNAFNGLISDGNSGTTAVVLQKQGAGKWIVSGNNTFTGGLDVNGGTLVLSGLNKYTGGTTLNNGTVIINTLKDFGTASSLGQAASGAILVERYNGTKTLSYVGSGDTSNRNFKFQGYNISGAPALTLTNDGSGALVFTAATFNEYSTSSNNVFTLNLGGTYTGGTNEIQGTIQNHFSGVSDVLNLTKNDNSIWKLSGANSYTGTTLINGGTLIVGSDSLSGTNGALGNATSEVALGVAGGNTNASLLIGGAYTVGRNLRISTNNTTDGGSRVLTIGGNTANNSEFSGNVFLGTTNQAGRGVNLVAASGGQVTFSGVIQNPTGMDATAYTVTKTGAGRVVLTNTNTYTGSTLISQGTLAINGTGSINNSAVTINGGNFRYNSSTAYTGALTFTSGAISGTNWTSSLDDLTIGANQTVSPGNSPGTAATGSQTWATGGSYEWEINSTLGNAGTDPGWDLINGTGTLTITATAGNEFTIDITSLTLGNLAGNVSDFNEANNYSWLIAEFATISGFDSTDFILDDSAFSNIYSGNFGLAFNDGATDQIFLTYTAIPEPKAVLLGVMGVLLLLRRRR